MIFIFILFFVKSCHNSGGIVLNYYSSDTYKSPRWRQYLGDAWCRLEMFYASILDKDEWKKGNLLNKYTGNEVEIRFWMAKSKSTC